MTDANETSPSGGAKRRYEEGMKAWQAHQQGRCQCGYCDPYPRKWLIAAGYTPLALDGLELMVVFNGAELEASA